MNARQLVMSTLLLLELATLLPSDEAHIHISVPTAFAVITAAVKVKAALMKTYKGLQTFGGYNQIPYARSSHLMMNQNRFRRSAISGHSTPQTDFRPEDLMSAWKELEKVSGRKLVFDETSCAMAKKADASQLPLWANFLQSEFTASMSNKEYSALVSSLIGSLTGDPRACQFRRIITANLMLAPVPVSVDFESVDAPAVQASETTTTSTPRSAFRRPIRRRKGRRRNVRKNQVRS